MTATLEVPRLTGGARRARAMVEDRYLEQSLEGATVVVDCWRLLAGTRSFASELLEQLIVSRHARQVKVINVDQEFAFELKTAAGILDELHGDVSERLEIQVL